MPDQDLFVKTLHCYRRAANIINKNFAIINDDNISKLIRTTRKNFYLKHIVLQNQDYTLALTLDINMDSLIQKQQRFLRQLNDQELKPFADQLSLLNHIVMCHLPLTQISLAKGKLNDINKPGFQTLDAALQDTTIPATLYESDAFQRFTIAATDLKLHTSALAMCIEKDLRRATNMYRYYRKAFNAFNKEIVARKTQTENLNALPKPYYVGIIRSFHHMIYR